MMTMYCLFLGVKVDGHDEPVQTQHLGEDQDEDHSDEESGLLRRAPHPRVAHHPDSVAGSQPRQAHWQPSPEMHETPKKNRLKHGAQEKSFNNPVPWEV